MNMMNRTEPMNIPIVRCGSLVLQDKHIIVSRKPDTAFIRAVDRNTSRPTFCIR